MQKLPPDLSFFWRIVGIVSLLVVVLSSCQRESHFSSYTPNSNKSSSGSGGMGMTYKTDSRSKPTTVNATTNTNKKKDGSSPTSSYAPKKTKQKKIKGFSVFERSKKLPKHDARLFPKGVSNKYHLHESKVSSGKAERMLKKSAEEPKKATAN